jgi:hypothetical protein
MRANRLVAFIALLSTHAAIGYAEDYVIPEGVDVLTEEQILTQVIGNTYVAGILWVEYYVPPVGELQEGRISGERLGFSYQGSWFVEGQLMCWKYDKGPDYDGCYSTSLDRGVVSWYDISGKQYKSLAGTVRLEKGNPKEL